MSTNPSTPPPADSTPPPVQPGESQWIMYLLTRLETQVSTYSEGHDERLRSVENSISSFKGWLTAIGTALVIIQIISFLALKFLDISLK